MAVIGLESPDTNGHDEVAWSGPRRVVVFEPARYGPIRRIKPLRALRELSIREEEEAEGAA